MGGLFSLVIMLFLTSYYVHCYGMGMSQKAKLSLTSSIVILIIVNLVPVLGIIFLHWKVADIVVLYVFETWVVGVFNIFKMIFASGGENPPGCIKFFLIPFFIVHYNGFVAIQGFFVIMLILAPELNNTTLLATTEGVTYTKSFEYLLNILSFKTQLSFAYLSIIISHLYSFVINYMLKKEYKNVLIFELMFLPYRRIIVQQIVVIGGTFLLLALNGNNMAFLITLIVVKIFFDIQGHHKERVKLQTAPVQEEDI